MSGYISRKLAVGAIAALLSSGAALAAATPGRIDVTNQKPAGDEITVADASLPMDGFLAIHASDAKGAMTDNTLGYIALKAGEHKSVKVHLTAPHKTGDKLWAVLHEDTSQKGTFEFGVAGKSGADMPIKVNGKVVEMPFTLQ